MDCYRWLRRLKLTQAGGLPNLIEGRVILFGEAEQAKGGRLARATKRLKAAALGHGSDRHSVHLFNDDLTAIALGLASLSPPDTIRGRNVPKPDGVRRDDHLVSTAFRCRAAN